MKKGFTLIELLIVVAIIAILAAIAVPNFLEAQTRSRVSRVQNDLRTIAVAMESYYVDNGGYPPTAGNSWLHPSKTASYMGRMHLTTPIAYINEIAKDVFRSLNSNANVIENDFPIYAVNYGANASGGPTYQAYPHNGWMTWSVGPDLFSNTGGYRTYPAILRNEELGPNGNYYKNPETDVPLGVPPPPNGNGLRYDPTNGTVSYGDVYRHEGEAKVRAN